jgi:hypothetical protein
MIGFLRLIGPMRPLVVAMVAGLMTPVLANAETMYIRNECPFPVVVQTGSVVRGVLRRDPPVALKMGEVTPGTMLPGNKIITIYDAGAPNRVLFQGTIPASIQDHQYGIVTDGLRMMLQPRKPFPPR